jgi:phytoene dehydrogenase-like protein
MVKSCRKYWTREIADMITPLRDVRFVNPQFDVRTTFTRDDYTRVLVERFGLERARVEAFFGHLAGMNFYDRSEETIGAMFERFFPGRDDVHRLLLEPIAYANGSALDDPSVAYAIVFGNFMGGGIHTFRGGSDLLIGKMVEELRRNGVELRKHVLVERVLVEERGGRKVAVGVVARGGRVIRSRAVLANSSLKNTLFRLAGEENLPPDYAAAARAVRVNSSSCQVYLGIRKGESLPRVGELIFASESRRFATDELLDFRTTSRAFSLYYPETRPGQDRHAVVASMNARYSDWQGLSEADYRAEKVRLIGDTITALEKFIPDVRGRIDWMEAATPRTLERYTTHQGGPSFGTKFEGLQVSMDLPERLPGLYHAGSVGIIMSGWLGAMNYGVIVAAKVERQL